MRPLRWALAAVVLAGTARGASSDAEAAEHRWLSRVVLDELTRCAGGAQWRRLGKHLEEAALARLACGRYDVLDDLVDVVYARRACTYLPMLAEADGGKELARWLLDHRDVSRLLFRALPQAEAPVEALRRFATLHAAEGKTILDYPDLAVAFATAEPLRHYRRQPAPADLLASFRYYTDPRRSFRHDLKAMPYELSQYLADTRANLAERRWAAETYRRRDPQRAYFHVRYDDAHFETGRAKRIDSVPYSLPNLSRLGGVCLDQAYFAAEVCKAVGIPAAVVHGRGGAGVEHAWFAHCRVSPAAPGRLRATWRSRTGRYQEHLYFVGTLRSPADGKTIFDSELMLLGSAVRLPLRRREEADAATALARLVDDCRDRGAAADPAALHDLAGTYRSRLANGPGAPPLHVNWIAARRKIDLAMLEDLLSIAIQRNLAHRPAWRFLVELREADRIPAGHLNRFSKVLIDKTADRYPEYSCLLVMQIAQTLPDAAHREEVYRRAITVYGKRADLRGRLLIALGDDLRRRGQTEGALGTYQDAAGHGVHLAEVVVGAARKAEQILLDTDRRDLAIRMYRELFAQTQRLKIADTFRSQTSHYQLGSRLAELLTAAGRKDDAKRVLSRL